MNAVPITRRQALGRLALTSTLPFAAGIIGGCATTGGSTNVSIETTPFGQMPDGRKVARHTLRNASGASISLAENGATMTSILVPDRSGKLANVVFGGDSLGAYLQGLPAASVVGRYANRIGKSRFRIDGHEYQITPNEGKNHLHGGREGFAAKVWQSRAWVDHNVAYAEFRYRSVDGEEGYPGNLQVKVTYAWSGRNEITLTYEAETDRPTVVNLTNHAYFNLAGAGQGNVFDHLLEIPAHQYTPCDSELIPTGKLASVTGTPLDFQTPHRIGERIKNIVGPNGYDHNFVLPRHGGGLQFAARVRDPQSGRMLECHTTEPGVQLYTANHFNGVQQPKYGAFCLETQHFPDSPNNPQFPSAVVRPGKPYFSQTRFRFSA